jgi:peptidoglycan/LPS O-acetylase OafA/YrhL
MKYFFGETQILKIDTTNRVFGLDLLRALAILFVFFGHGAFLYFKAYPEIYRFDLIDGVDIFFVLSGFLIGSIIIRLMERRGFSVNELKFFLLKRWIRTIPNYLWILIWIVLLSSFTNYPFKHDTISWKHFIFIQNLFYPHPGFFPEAWSLAVEEWFYLVFPISMFFLLKKLNIKRALLFSIMYMIFTSLLYKYYKSLQFEPSGYNYDVYFRKIVIARIDSIAFGVLASYIKFYYSSIFTKYKFYFLVAGLLGIWLVSNIDATKFYLIFFSSLLSFSVSLCIPWFDSLNNYPKYFGNLILYLAVISYSLYLVHLSLILIPIQSFIDLNSKYQTFIGYCLYVIISMTLATLNYRYIEFPILNWRDRKIK